MRLQLLCGCHQELWDVTFQKFLNSGDIKAGIVGRPANSVSMHPHVEFFIMEAVLEHPEKTLSEIVYSVYAQTGSEFPLASIFYYLQ